MKNSILTVIIPTSGTLERKESLFRAIGSALKQQGISVQVRVVVNGNSFFNEIFKYIDQMENVDYIYLTEGSLPSAISHGRKSVTSKYFCFLDDDDEFIKDALGSPIRVLNENSEIDLVVVNGFRVKCNERENRQKYFQYFPRSDENPTTAFRNGVWLASCGAVYRSDSVESRFFESIYKFYEWTSIALQLAISKGVYFHDYPCFIVNVRDNSLSGSEEYRLAELGFVQYVLSQEKYPREIKDIYKSKLCSIFNGMANDALKREDRREALRFHLKCLSVLPQGLRYFSWSRFLF